MNLAFSIMAVPGLGGYLTLLTKFTGTILYDCFQVILTSFDFSNTGYIWFGLCFIVLVKIKSLYFPEDHCLESHESDQGLPQQYSVFYAMGLAMIFQARKLFVSISIF